jgi:hypothetical protein
MAASDLQLGELHGLVARSLTARLEGGEFTAAELGAAISFLKNNNITADASDNAELKELSATLAARRRKKLPQAALDEASRVFEELQGQNGLIQ